MVTIAHIGRSLPALALMTCLTSFGFSQTAPAPESVLPDPTLPDAENFFIEYARAVEQFQHGDQPVAALVMATLCKRLTTSPWREIALLKHGELTERQSAPQALVDYQLLAQRLTTEPHFHAETTGPLRTALRGAADGGVGRIRLKHIDDVLGQYFARFGKYPESLAMLTSSGMLEPEYLLDLNQCPFRYTPRSLKLPKMEYLSYELERIPAEPFAATEPRIQSTTRVSEKPDRYVALIQTHPRKNPQQVNEGQTLDGYYVVAVVARGAIVCSHNRVLILPATH